LKLIAAIVVFSLVVASLSVAGCTTTTNNTNQTPSASATSSIATHDAFFEKYLAAYKTNRTTQESSQHVKAWEVTWINSTSARVEWSVLDKTTNNTWRYVETISVFPTSQDATNFVNAITKTSYNLASTEYGTGGAYQNVTGHAPQIYKKYEWNEGDPSNTSEYTYHEIQQLDNIVFVTTGKILS